MGAHRTGSPDGLVMVVAYELMFTVDGDGFYLENMIAVRNDSYEMMAPGLPYTARAVEAAMPRRASPGGQ